MNYQDCKTCEMWENGLTMVDCYAKHHYNKETGCSEWINANKENYTEEDIKNGKVIDPTISAYLCDDADDNI